MKSKLRLFRTVHANMEMCATTISPSGLRDAMCPVLGEGGSAHWLTVREVGGAEGLVRETISWIANRSFKRCRGLLIPISLWISVSDRADMMAPLFTLARQAATYQAGIPSQSCWIEKKIRTQIIIIIEISVSLWARHYSKYLACTNAFIATISWDRRSYYFPQRR